MQTLRSWLLAMVLGGLIVNASASPLAPRDNSSITLLKGHSRPVQFNSDIDTLAIGSPDILQVSTLKPNLIMLSGQRNGSTSLTVFFKNGTIFNHVVHVTNDSSQLVSLINQIEKNVSVDEVGEVIVLKGTVKTPAALVRVLSLADRFISSSAEPDFSVISDKGGVLSGNTDEKSPFEPVEPVFGTQTIPLGQGQGNTGASSQSAGGAGGANGARGSGIQQVLNQPLYPTKGNIAQNLSRSDVIMLAGGRVMSLIKVEGQPKVEIQMRIVAVDRTKTDELGLDWRLTSGSSSTGVTINSSLGKLTNKDGKANGLETIGIAAPGSTLGLTAFLRLIEQKGALSTLSEPLLTALSGESASFLVGGSLPIPVQTISPGVSNQGPVLSTNVRFIQYGLRLIVRPTVLENGKISIVLDQSISEPDYVNSISILATPIPSFKQRTVSTLTESESGESWAVAGLLNEEQNKNLSSIPYISQIPILGNLFKKKNNALVRQELFIVVNAKSVDVGETTQNFDNHGELSLPPSEKKIVSKQEEYESASITEQDTVSNKEGSDAKYVKKTYKNK